MGGKRPGGKRPGGKRHGGQKVGGQKVGGQKTGGQKTGGQKTGGQKSCHRGSHAGLYDVPVALCKTILLKQQHNAIMYIGESEESISPH